MRVGIPFVISYSVVCLSFIVFGCEFVHRSVFVVIVCNWGLVGHFVFCMGCWSTRHVFVRLLCGILVVFARVPCCVLPNGCPTVVTSIVDVFCSNRRLDCDGTFSEFG